MRNIQWLDKDQKREVGFTWVIEQLNVLTPYGKEKVKKIVPYDKRQRRELELDYENIDMIIAINEKDPKLIKNLLHILKGIKELRGTIKRSSSSQVLDDTEFFELKSFSMQILKLMDILDASRIRLNEIEFKCLKDVISILNPSKQVNSSFYIYDDYSDELKKCREEKRSLERKIAVESDVEKKDLLRAGRQKFVLEEMNEEARLRSVLSKKISEYINVVEFNVINVGKLDFLIAKALLTIKMKARRPVISEDRVVLLEAWHPFVQQKLLDADKSFTPINIELSNGVTVITGANMGGKSVALKTVLLNVLLAQCGFFVFAKEMKFSIMEFFAYVNGDNQSVEHGLSSFGAEVIMLNELSKSVLSKNGLVILDEFAKSTNPKEGFAFVKGVCEFLKELHSISLVVTHYDGVQAKDYRNYRIAGISLPNSYKCEDIYDMSAGVNKISEYMDYSLLSVDHREEVPKEALKIAELLCLDSRIGDKVKVILNKEEGNGK